MNKAIKEVTQDIEEFRFNSAINKLIKFEDYLDREMTKESFKVFLKLFSPFAPHIAEELWHDIGNKSFISIESWPKVDEKKIDEKIEKEEEQVNTTIEDVKNIAKIIKEKNGKEIKKVYIYVIPKELVLYKENRDLIERSLSAAVEIFSNNDSLMDLK